MQFTKVGELKRASNLPDLQRSCRGLPALLLLNLRIHISRGLVRSHTALDSLDSPYPSPMDVLVIQVCVCLLANGALMYICLYTNFYSNAATCTFVLFCCCCDAKFQPAQNFKPPHGWTQDRYMQAGILASYNTAFLPSKDGFENFGGPY